MSKEERSVSLSAVISALIVLITLVGVGVWWRAQNAQFALAQAQLKNDQLAHEREIEERERQVRLMAQQAVALADAQRNQEMDRVAVREQREATAQKGAEQKRESLPEPPMPPQVQAEPRAAVPPRSSQPQFQTFKGGQEFGEQLQARIFRQGDNIPGETEEQAKERRRLRDERFAKEEKLYEAFKEADAKINKASGRMSRSDGAKYRRDKRKKLLEDLSAEYMWTTDEITKIVDRYKTNEQ